MRFRRRDEVFVGRGRFRFSEMYEAFYQLSKDPFRLLPDPEICYPHSSCAKAWAYLQYAVGRGEGIVIVTGVPGSGKTTLAERLLRELASDQTVSVRLAASNLDPTNLLRKLAYSFGLAAEGLDHAMLLHRIERFLIQLERSHRRALVIIDEAQNLSHDSLEAMRLLTDLQSHAKPLLQLFLLGHEELEMVMSAPRMAQFQQRVIASCRLQPMTLSETKAYLEYRLAHAAWDGNPGIDGRAVMAIHFHSGGLPRQINKICSRLFLYGGAEEKTQLTARDVKAVVQDLRDELLEPFGEAEEATVPELIGDADGVRRLALESRQPKRRAQGVDPVSNSDSRPAARPAAITPIAERPASVIEAATEPRVSVEGSEPTPAEKNEKGGFFLTDRYPLGRQSAGVARSVARGVRAAVGGRLRSVTRAGQVWYRFARENLSKPIDKRLAPIGRGLLSGKPLAVGAVASLTVVSIAAAMVLNRPAPPPDDPAAVRSVAPAPQPTTPPPQAIQEVVAAPSVEPPPPMEGVADNKTVLPPPADEPVVEYLTTEGGGDRMADVAFVGLVHLAAIEPTSIETQTGETVEATFKSTPSAEVEIFEGDIHTATGTPALAVIDESDNLVTDDDPSLFLPPPAAGSPGVPVDDSTIPTDRDEVGLLPVVQDAAEPSDILPSDMPPALDAPEEIQLASLEVEELGLLTVSSEPISEIPQSDSETVFVDGTHRDAAEIERLLALAGEAMRRDRLLFPESDSAYGYYRQVLELDGQNSEALAGMDRIADRYGALAERALQRRQLDRADLFVGRALRVAPDHPRAPELRRKIAAIVAQDRAQAERLRQAEHEAEAARLAAEAAARAEAARQLEAIEMRKSFDELIWRN